MRLPTRSLRSISQIFMIPAFSGVLPSTSSIALPVFVSALNWPASNPTKLKLKSGWAGYGSADTGKRLNPCGNWRCPFRQPESRCELLPWRSTTAGSSARWISLLIMIKEESRPSGKTDFCGYSYLELLTPESQPLCVHPVGIGYMYLSLHLTSHELRAARAPKSTRRR